MASTAEWLARQGWRVQVITVQPSYPLNQMFSKALPERSVEKGVEVRRLPAPVSRRGTVLSRILPEFSFLLTLLRLKAAGELRRQSCIVSLCPSIFAVIAAGLLRGRQGQHVAVVHDVPSGLGEALGWQRGGAVLSLVRLVEAYALNAANAVLTLSPHMERALRDLGVHRPIHVHPPHLDVQSLAFQPQSAAASTWMYSGNLGRKQGLDQLLDLAQWLKRKELPARLVIQGEGSQRAQLERTAAAQGFDNVQFRGLAAREELARSLGEARLHVVPQVPGSSGFVVPSKIYTLMAIGRPFVAVADAGSVLEEVAKESQAFLTVPPGDLDALGEACLRLDGDVALREAMAQRGRAYVHQVADTAVVMARFAELLRPTAEPPREAAALATAMA